ncbi:MAG: glycosyltransferase family 4 protein [Puniceicoccaceae bacterium]
MRKVLLVVYAWPPAGGPGVQRCLKFVKYLLKFDWEPLILTVENAETSAEDPTLLGQVPEGLKICRTRSIEPFGLYKRVTGRKQDERLPTGLLQEFSRPSWKETLARWVRANCFIPDAKIGWLPFGISKGKRLLDSENIDLIFSSGPPHSTHLIARVLAELSGLPWVVDFRDPWVDIDYYHFTKRSKLSTCVDQTLEKSCLQRASAITTVCQGLVSLLNAKTRGSKTHLLPNGYDSSDIPKRSSRPSNRSLCIFYGGTLGVDRIPYALISALEDLRKETAGCLFKLQVAGNSCSEFENLLVSKNLEDYWVELGYLPHSQALQKLIDADISLLTINRVPGNQRIVTGKIFEYMAAGNPILGIGPTDGDAARLLIETGSGRMFDYDDSAGILRFLREASEDYDSFRKSFRFDCENYSREHLTGQLAKIFDHLTTKKPQLF